MKKLFLASALGLFVLASSAGIVGHHFVETHAEGVKGDLATLLTGYISGGTYTKKTAIYLTDEVVSGNLSYFHARTNRMKITTYYDETAGALLMGDYDGGFNFNTGFKNDGTGSCNHFRYSGYGDPSTSDLFTNISTDWKASGQTVGTYYRTLTSLANYVTTSDDETNTWTQNDSVFVHTINHTEAGPNGYYYDETLHNFMFFAAPMLLDKVTETAFLNFTRIVVQPANGFLSIRLYVSETDAGKTSLPASYEGEYLLSEARITSGLSFFDPDETKYAIVGGFTKWDENPLQMSVDPDYPGCYRVDATLDEYAPFKIYTTDANNNHAWLNNVKTNHWQWLGGGSGSDNLFVRVAGDFKFHYDPSEGVFVDVAPTIVHLFFNGMPYWVMNGASVFAYFWDNDFHNAYVAVSKVNDYNATIELDTSAIGFVPTECLLVRCHSETVTPNWKTTGDVAGRIYNQTWNCGVPYCSFDLGDGAWSAYNPS